VGQVSSFLLGHITSCCAYVNVSGSDTSSLSGLCNTYQSYIKPGIIKLFSLAFHRYVAKISASYDHMISYPMLHAAPVKN
jgi:hypothetical protein